MIKHLQRRVFTGTALALGLAATLSAWAPAASAQSVADIKKKGELTIGMLVDFPPYGSRTAATSLTATTPMWRA
jgi:polar amino acid transport system substrate-binding protein